MVTVGSEKLASDKEEQVYTGGALDILAEAVPSASDESIDPAMVRAKVRNDLSVKIRNMNFHSYLYYCCCNRDIYAVLVCYRFLFISGNVICESERF